MTEGAGREKPSADPWVRGIVILYAFVEAIVIAIFLWKVR